MKKNKLLTDILQGLLMAAAVAVAMPHLAFAQSDLNSSVDQLTQKELTNVPDLINAVFYIGGAAFTGSGLLKLKAYSENPTSAPLAAGVSRISVGAALLALPYISTAVITSFGFGNNAAVYQKFNQVQ